MFFFVQALKVVFNFSVFTVLCYLQLIVKCFDGANFYTHLDCSMF